MTARQYLGAFLPVCSLWLILVVAIDGNHSAPTGKLNDWERLDDTYLDRSRYPGEWYTIDCRLKDATAEVSLWRGESDSEDELFVDQKKFKLSNQIFNVTMLTFDDEGSYYCKAKNRTNKYLGYLSLLRDGKAYQTPNITNGTQIVKDIGDTVIIDCEIRGWYSMRWYKGNQTLTSKDISHYRNNIRMTKKRLELSIKTLDNGGKYTCEAERFLLLWKAKDEITVDVQRKDNKISTTDASNNNDNKDNNKLPASNNNTVSLPSQCKPCICPKRNDINKI